jgi:hypothetical protein
VVDSTSPPKIKGEFMAKSVRLSAVKDTVIEYTGMMKEKAINEVIKDVKTHLPNIIKNDKKWHMSTVTEKQAKEIVERITGVKNKIDDFKEHLYLHFIKQGVIVVPDDLGIYEDRKTRRRRMIEIFINPFGIVDLGSYKKQFKYPLNKYAEYIRDKFYRFKPREISKDEYKARIEGKDFVPSRDKPKIAGGIDVTNTDKAVRPGMEGLVDTVMVEED